MGREQILRRPGVAGALASWSAALSSWSGADRRETCMPARQSTKTPLAPELEAIATAAADRVRARADAIADDGGLQPSGR